MANIIHKWILQIISSLGLKRKLTALLQAAAGVASMTPGLQVFAPFIQAIASWLGIVGIGHATLAGSAKVDLHTVTAFFSALLLAAHGSPELAVFLPVIQMVATILGLFTSVQLIGNREK